MAKIVIFGAGDIARLAHFYFSTDSEHEVVAFTVDAEYLTGETFLDLPLVPFDRVASIYPPSSYKMFVALSYAKMNQVREAKYREARALGYDLVSYVSSRCSFLTQYPHGDNCFILEDNTVQPFVRIGSNVTLWSGNHIGHDSSDRRSLVRQLARRRLRARADRIQLLHRRERDARQRHHDRAVHARRRRRLDHEGHDAALGIRAQPHEALPEDQRSDRPVDAMRWLKQGLIVSPNAQAPWVGTHAALPVVSPLEGRQRIYFSSRDARNRAHIGYVTLSLSNRDEPQEFSPSAILSPGALGTFDDAGVTSSCVVEHAVASTCSTQDGRSA